MAEQLLKLRDYQQQGIDAIIRYGQSGGKRALMALATGGGKAQPLDEPVLTPSGWRPIGALAVGDLVIGADGKPTEVTGRFPQGRRPVLRVRFSDGATVRCNPEHLWAVQDKYDVHDGKPWRVLTTAEVQMTLRRRWRVPLMEPPDLRVSVLPLDPYVLGVLLGDGGLSIPGRVSLHTRDLTAAALTLPEGAYLTRLHGDGPAGVASTFRIGGRHGCKGNAVLHGVRALGLEGCDAQGKFIPPAYLLGRAGARLELLRGLMDTDGTASGGTVEFSTVSDRLAQDVVALVRSLGGTARLVRKHTTWIHNGERRNGLAWRVYLYLDICPFRVARKAAQWEERSHPVRRFIEAVEQDADAEQVCISVANPAQLYVTNDCVLTHNTIIFAHLAARAQRGKALVLAHREELLDQAAEKLHTVHPGLRIGIEQGERHHRPTDQVVVASIQSLVAQDRARLKRLDPAAFSLVITDEAHHATARSYVEVYGHFGLAPNLPGIDARYRQEMVRAQEKEDAAALKDLRRLHKRDVDAAFETFRVAPSAPFHLGVTATPTRTDGVGLEYLFDELVFARTIRDLMEAGWLAKVRGVRVTTDADISGVEVRRGDYAEGALAQAVDTATRNRLAVETWETHAAQRQTLVFAVNVAHARHLAEAFRARGIRAAWASGTTDKDERARLVADYRSGRVQVLVNCFDASTELLTADGWKSVEALHKGMGVATMNLQTGGVEWQPLNAVIRRPRAPGERMVRVKNQTLDLRVTEGHRMVVRSPGAKGWGVVEARDLVNRRGAYQFPLAGLPVVPFTGVPLTNVELEFLGLFATDGSLNRKRASIEISQAADSPVCAEIERVLTACRFDWKVTEKLQTTNMGTGRLRVYRIPRGNIGGLLARRGWDRLEAWLDKSLSPALGEMTPDQFRYLLYGLWMGDGLRAEARGRPRHGTAICGVDAVLFDRLQQWAVERGWATSLTWHPNGDGHKPLGVVRLRERQAVTTNNHTIPTSGGNPAVFEEEWRAEEVWCVSTHNGTVVTRRNGRVTVTGQCMLYTEGFDAPETACVLMARPTRSSLVYSQCLGRGTRIAPGKADLLVVDLVDAARAGVQSLNVLFGLPPLFRLAGVDLLAALRAVERHDPQVPPSTLAQVEDEGDIAGALREIDPLAAARADSTLRRFAKLRWIRASWGYGLSLPEVALGVVEDLLGHGVVKVKRKGERQQVLHQAQTVADAIVWAERWVKQAHPDAGGLLNARARWGQDPPTEAQRNHAAWIGVEVTASDTKGSVAAKIAAKKGQAFRNPARQGPTR